MKEHDCGQATIQDIRRFDVLMGRGKFVHQHSGNIVYRREVKERSLSYSEGMGLKRDAIAREVIQWVWNKGGRFLRRLDDTYPWEECPNSIVRAKVKQALRDFVKEKTPRRTKAKRSGSESDCADQPAGAEKLDLCRTSTMAGITVSRNEDLSAWGLRHCRPLEPCVSPATLLTDAESRLQTMGLSDIHRHQFPLLVNPSLDHIQSTITLPWWGQRMSSAVPSLEPHRFPSRQDHSDAPPVGGLVWLENVLRDMEQQGEDNSDPHLPRLDGEHNLASLRWSNYQG